MAHGAEYLAIPKSSHASVEVATGTALKTLLQVATPSTTGMMICGWGWSMDGTSGSAAPGQVDLIDAVPADSLPVCRDGQRRAVARVV
jgi:hypothetical protein